MTYLNLTGTQTIETLGKMVSIPNFLHGTPLMESRTVNAAISRCRKKSMYRGELKVITYIHICTGAV